MHYLSMVYMHTAIKMCCPTLFLKDKKHALTLKAYFLLMWSSTDSMDT